MGDDFTQKGRERARSVRKDDALPSTSEVWAIRGMHLQRVLGHEAIEQYMSYRYLEAKKKKEEFMQKGVIGPMDVRV